MSACAISEGKSPETASATGSDKRTDAQVAGDTPSLPLPDAPVAKPDRETRELPDWMVKATRDCRYTP